MRFAKVSHIQHPSFKFIFLNLRMCNSAHVRPTTLKYAGTFLSYLYYYKRKYIYCLYRSFTTEQLCLVKDEKSGACI